MTENSDFVSLTHKHSLTCCAFLAFPNLILINYQVKHKLLVNHTGRQANVTFAAYPIVKVHSQVFL